MSKLSKYILQAAFLDINTLVIDWLFIEQDIMKY
jgi:hypothetical protein